MHRLGRLFDRSRAAIDPTSLDAVAEAQNMEKALIAAELIMNDDIAGAEAELAKGDSAFHKLARGTLGFLKATLGFEQDAMKEASDLLSDAENSAYLYHQRAMHDPNVVSSTIYDRGSEFALCQAEAQIMNAIVGILNESLTESIKGFYKMRKAYMTLEHLAKMETVFMRKRGLKPLNSTNASRESFQSSSSIKPNNLDASKTAAGQHPSALRNATTPGAESDSSNDDFFEANEIGENRGTTAKDNHTTETSKQVRVEDKMSHLHVSLPDATTLREPSPVPSGASTPGLQAGATTPILESPLNSQSGLLNVDADSDVFTNSLDVFIHSAVNLMSGLINLLLSIIPPAFGRLLSVIGFRGEREKGLRMLWQASKFSNINGGMASLILFGWYNGIIGFCDIVSDSDPNIPDDVNGFPMKRLHTLLGMMRKRYPGSLMWKIEEARTFSTQRQTRKALEILNQPHQTQMKQLEALHVFEKSLDCLNSHQYEQCANNFLKCVELNAWSQALYYYSAAAAYLQLYRDLKGGSDPDLAEKYRALAEKHFKFAPSCAGKKKTMGRQLPFDTFVVRKIAKWTERSNEWGCSFIDAVGVAPLEEIALLWNGFKKMDETQLKKSLENVGWLEINSPFWNKESDNEKAIMTILKATVVRHLRHHEESKELLQEKLLSYDSYTFRGTNEDNWVGPAANYEMATNLWMQRREYVRRYGSTLVGMEHDTEKVEDDDIQQDASLVAETKKYLEKAKGWGGYELDVRIGMKVTAGLGAVNKWEARHKDLLK